LAVTAAHQIEETLRSRELARAVQLLHWYQLQASRWPHQAAVLLDHKGRVVSANTLARTLFRDGRDHTPLEPGRPFLRVDSEPTLAHCTAVLPPGVRAVGLESYAGRGRPWDGGLLVLEAARGAPSLAARGSVVAPDPFPGIAGTHPLIVEMKRQAARVARAAAPVLLLGETGVGKTLWARSIHQASASASGPWVVANCAQLSRELAASELFGEECGAFMGAVASSRAGKFEQADGGTLLLTDFSELPLEVQAGVLHVAQKNVLVRVGSHRERSVRVRLIAASHRDLASEVAQGRLRQDFLDHLQVLTLQLPALRDHLEDLPAIVHQLLAQIQVAHGLGARQAGPELLAAFGRAHWPGNVRELRARLESLYVLSEQELLSTQDLPADFLRQLPAATSASAPAPLPISALERSAIEVALTRYGSNLSEVARRLGISRSTLYRKMQRYGLVTR
jgi:DNA-binding NtrC family response regulator